ncbi:MAG: hypothetical protein RLZZ25_1208 [Gemmatimonadota bacterium]|jgi:hypothetical protein
MAKTPQSYANHAMYQPLWHYWAVPAALFYLLYCLVALVRGGITTHEVFDLIGAVGLNAGIWASRIMALTVQDRIIRLEMRLRLREVLPAPLVARIPELTKGQLIGLRFASDAELPGLVERILRRELVKAKEVKAAVKDWQADHLRA